MSDFDKLRAEEFRALVREVMRDVLSSGLPVTETVVERLLDLDPDQREITEVLLAVAGQDHVAGRER